MGEQRGEIETLFLRAFGVGRPGASVFTQRLSPPERKASRLLSRGTGEKRLQKRTWTLEKQMKSIRDCSFPFPFPFLSFPSSSTKLLLAQRELGRARAGVEDEHVVREAGDDDGVEEVGGHGEAHFGLFEKKEEKKSRRELTKEKRDVGLRASRAVLHSER